MNGIAGDSSASTALGDGAAAARSTVASLRRLVGPVVIVGTALLVAACGGSSLPATSRSRLGAANTHTAAAPVRLRTNFAAAGLTLVRLRHVEDLACTRFVDRLVVAHSLLQSSSGFKGFLDAEIAAVARFNAVIYRSSAPRADAADYKHFVYANEGALDLLRKLEPYLLGTSKNKSATAALMERAAVADRDAAKYGHRLGLSACATGQKHRG